ncbi:hypothetical protein Q672_10565 [Marinobacter sp. EVN1]|uniref:hypothetical protein n=1 Tax=Marinobacter sp. EVN1 TaxID=1397532 RepID=UPI0003B8BD41|nr:hypothetical protein [Marinobacter sp. EVN1]ERS88447.1 hypothetical protein Q672_10565 [Marinobacter sp. EVN1]
MPMKFGRAYCEELQEPISSYKAREIYTDEDDERFGKRLTFSCEDCVCRARLTAVGVYMPRKSKRALHFRSLEDHVPECGFLRGNATRGADRGDGRQEDDFKITQFPTELDLTPRRRTRAGAKPSASTESSDGSAPGRGRDVNGESVSRRRTSTRTRYLDYVVDCFLSGDEDSKKKDFTVAGKTKAFRQFFKRIRYFQDEQGLIYYGAIDKLKVYKNKGVGLRFVEYIWSGERKQRVWAYIPQEHIDGSSRRRAFLAEMQELESAMAAKEVVEAYFVGAYPQLEIIQRDDGKAFESYKAELSRVDHISLRFAK